LHNYSIQEDEALPKSGQLFWQCFGLSITTGFHNHNSPLLSPYKIGRERANSMGSEIWQFEKGHEGNVETKK